MGAKIQMFGKIRENTTVLISREKFENYFLEKIVKTQQFHNFEFEIENKNMKKIRQTLFTFKLHSATPFIFTIFFKKNRLGVQS